MPCCKPTSLCTAVLNLYGFYLDQDTSSVTYRSAYTHTFLSIYSNIYERECVSPYLCVHPYIHIYNQYTAFQREGADVWMKCNMSEIFMWQIWKHVLAWLQKRQIWGTKAGYILEYTLYGR